MGLAESLQGQNQEHTIGIFTHNLQEALLNNPNDTSTVSKILNFGIEDLTPEGVQSSQAFVTLACDPLQSLAHHDPRTTNQLLTNPIVLSFFKNGEWIQNPSIKFIASTAQQAVIAAEKGEAQIDSIEFHSPASCGYHCAFCFKETEPEAKDLYRRAHGQGVTMVTESFWQEAVNAVLESRGEEANHTTPFSVLQSGCADSEPTLSPFFEDFLRNNRAEVANKFGEMIADLIKHDVYTIGITLRNPSKRKALLECDQVRVSLFSPNHDEYSRISGVNSHAFHGVITGLKSLITERDQQGSKTKISTSYLAIPGNYQSLKGMLDLCGEIGIDYLDLRSLHGETIDDLSAEEKAEYAATLRDIYHNKDQYPFRINFGYTPAAFVLGSQAQQIQTLNPDTIDIKMLNRFFAGPQKLTVTQSGVLLGFSPGTEAGNFIPNEIVDSPFAVGILDAKNIENWTFLMNALSKGTTARVNNSAVRTLQQVDPSNPRDRDRVRRITTGSILAYNTIAAITDKPIEQVKSHPYLSLFNTV